LFQTLKSLAEAEWFVVKCRGRCFSQLELRLIGAGRDVAAVAGPVGVDEFSRPVQKLVRVSAEVIPLGLK